MAAGQGVPGGLERGQAPDVLPNQMLVWMEMRDRSQGRLHQSDPRKRKHGASTCCEAGRWGGMIWDTPWEVSGGLRVMPGICPLTRNRERAGGRGCTQQGLDCNPSEKRSGEGKDKEKGSKDCRGQRIMGIKVTEGACGETGGENGRLQMEVPAGGGSGHWRGPGPGVP